MKQNHVMVKDKIPFSVAMITYNESKNIQACLKSVDFADQIVVVDSGSTDDTVLIARRFNCEIYTEPWQGFSAQKQFAIDRCSHRWVLLLDADERIPPPTASVIKNIVSSNPGGFAAYSFPRKNFFQGRWIKHLWGGDRIIRLFQKHVARMTPVRVHEGVEVDGPVENLQVPIEHFTESDLSKLLIKIDRYSTLGAKDALDKGKKASVWTAALVASFAFFQAYVLKQGFLDGPQGFTLSVAESVNRFFKYAKMSERHPREMSDSRDVA